MCAPEIIKIRDTLKRAKLRSKIFLVKNDKNENEGRCDEQ